MLRINIFCCCIHSMTFFVKIVKIWFFGALTFPRTATERTHHPPYKRWLRVARLKSWENTGLTFWRLTFSTKDNRKNAPPVLCMVGACRSVEIWRKNRFCHFTEKQKLTISFLFFFCVKFCMYFCMWMFDNLWTKNTRI